MARNPMRTPVMLLVAASLLTAPMAFAKGGSRLSAQQFFKGEVKAEIGELVEVEVDRDIDLLPREIEPPIDPDVADTALIFTNLGSRRAAVKCIGFNKDGRPIGRIVTRIPALGVRYVLASDLSNGLDFIGQVQCAQHGPVHGTAVFIGAGFTDLPVVNGGPKNRIRFPFVAHY